MCTAVSSITATALGSPGIFASKPKPALRNAQDLFDVVSKYTWKMVAKAIFLHRILNLIQLSDYFFFAFLHQLL